VKGRQIGKKMIQSHLPLARLTADIEELVKGLGPNEHAIEAVVCINETTPYIDAAVIIEFLMKAAVRTGKKTEMVSAGVDNTRGEYSVELFVMKPEEGGI